MSVKFHNQINFKRKLRKNEQAEAQVAINSALKCLDKEFGIIFPDSMAPNEVDTGMNTMSGTFSQNLFLSFLLQNGVKINTLQDLPSGLRKKTDSSPFVSNSALTDLFRIDLKSLTTEKYGKILSDKTFSKIIKANENNNPYTNNFDFAIKNRDEIQKEIFDTFTSKLKNPKKLSETEKTAIFSLNRDFEKIKKEKGEKFEKFALYDILTRLHNCDYYPQWNDETDKNLFNRNYDSQKRKDRLNSLKKEYKKDINAFIFAQMLAEKFIKAKVKNLRRNGINIYNDIPISFSDAEAWANPNAFSDTLRLDAKDTRIHHWDFRCLDHTKFFNKDGSLGESGKILYDKYKSNFEKYGFGSRIDHVMGLINPWICDAKDANNGKRAYEETFNGNISKVLTDIILPAAQEAGIDTKNILAEDVGYFPENAQDALSKLNCFSMNLSRYKAREKFMNAKENTLAMAGSHDDIPLVYQEQMKLPENQKHNWNIIKDKVQERFIDLFTCPSKKVQIFLTDLLGMKISMKPMDTQTKDRWALRVVPDTFDKHYQEALQDNMGFNMPEILLEALKRKFHNFENLAPALARTLDKYSNILKEPE